MFVDVFVRQPFSKSPLIKSLWAQSQTWCHICSLVRFHVVLRHSNTVCAVCVCVCVSVSVCECVCCVCVCMCVLCMCVCVVCMFMCVCARARALCLKWRILGNDSVHGTVIPLQKDKKKRQYPLSRTQGHTHTHTDTHTLLKNTVELVCLF